MTGPLVCPKCKNMNTIAYGKGNTIERIAKIFFSVEKDGKKFWNFSITNNFLEDEFFDEETVNKKYTTWICPPGYFTLKEIDGTKFITKGCGFFSNKFNDFLPIIYEENDFINKKMIKKAHYGKIYSAYSIKDKEEICLKIIDLEEMKFDYEQNDLKDYKTDSDNEIEMLTLFSNNENSVKFYGAFIKDNKRYIITEKCDLNLKEFIKKRGKPLEIEEIKKNFIPINDILKLMQMKLIIHRDLKLENFLVKYVNPEKTEYKIKLCDYGISKFINKDNGIFSGIKGSEDTIAPEIRLQKIQNYQSNVDIFSLGIIFYQLSHSMKHPFGPCHQDCYNAYKAHYENDDIQIEFDESIKNEDFKDLLRKMLKLNPKNRISWQNYFSHPFFGASQQNDFSGIK